ncbi:hypothetical protein F4810DRAFT_723345 [Camillea tinctor]|nr:hypothetical protein F4810DRAFT_723345 [Camillea tinctor]
MSVASKTLLKEGSHKRFEEIASQEINAQLDKEEKKESARMENDFSRKYKSLLPFNDFQTPMALGPEYVAREVQKTKDKILAKQRTAREDPRLKKTWSGDILSGMTSAKDLPDLPVPGLGKRMFLDPDWSSAPPRTEPWPPRSAPVLSHDPTPYSFLGTNTTINNYPNADAAAYAPHLLSGSGLTNTGQQFGGNDPTPYNFYGTNATINDYPNAAAAYAPHLLPGSDSINISQYSGGSDPTPSTSQRPSQNPGAHVSSKTKSKASSRTQSTTKHRRSTSAATSSPRPPVAFTSPGYIGRNWATTAPLARSPSAAPRALVSAPTPYNYNSPTGRENSHSTTRALSRATSAAPASPFQSPYKSHGSMGPGRSVRAPTQSLPRTPSAAPAVTTPVHTPGGYNEYQSLQAFGMTPFAIASSPATAPPPAPSPTPDQGQYVNPQDLILSPRAPATAPPAASPNNDDNSNNT